jgi:hypothetical protein
MEQLAKGVTTAQLAEALLAAFPTRPGGTANDAEFSAVMARRVIRRFRSGTGYGVCKSGRYTLTTEGKGEAAVHTLTEKSV